MQYATEIVSAYLTNEANPIALMDGVGDSISSSLGTYKEKIGLLKTARIVHARAFIPCVSEKISTDKPSKKDNERTQPKLNDIGNRIIK